MPGATKKFCFLAMLSRNFMSSFMYEEALGNTVLIENQSLATLLTSKDCWF